jgi:ankyrin repeat protein
MSPEELRQQEVDELLHFAAADGDVDMLQDALARVRSSLPRQRARRRRRARARPSALTRARRRQGADVHSRDRSVYNQTALHAASQFGAGHTSTARALLAAGADVNARSSENSTALHEAAFWAHAVPPGAAARRTRTRARAQRSAGADARGAGRGRTWCGCCSTAGRTPSR